MATSTPTSKPKPINAGIIGLGSAAQAIHIPVLNQLSHLFQVTYLCSSSPSAQKACSQRVLNHVPKTTHSTADLCAAPDVDVVFVLSADELHPTHAKLALAHDKHVFVEKPLALSLADARAVVEAEGKSRGSVFVGYMRRYAAGFEEIGEEIKQLGGVKYARVRDIIGSNSDFVSQSSTFPQRFTDYPPSETTDRAALLQKTLHQALSIECNVPTTPDLITRYTNLSSLGSHDLSAMRELLGMPESVVGASLGNAFWNVLFKYPEGFTVCYESGVHNIPSFDAHIEVYGEDKSVMIKWENPFIRGLPVTTTTRDRVEGGGFRETHVRRTYEDPFVREMKEVYAMVKEGRKPKTSAEDAMRDVEVWQLVVKAAARCNLQTRQE